MIKSEKEFEKIIEEFFVLCKVEKKVPTKASFLLKLGLSNRDTYNRWKKESDALKKAELMIEDVWLQRLEGSSTGGAIFYLKNAFQYRDRTETDVTTGGDKLIPIYAGVSRYARNSKDIQPKEKD